jgi:hypothetical protein
LTAARVLAEATKHQFRAQDMALLLNNPRDHLRRGTTNRVYVFHNLLRNSQAGVWLTVDDEFDSLEGEGAGQFLSL